MLRKKHGKLHYDVTKYLENEEIMSGLKQDYGNPAPVGFELYLKFKVIFFLHVWGSKFVKIWDSLEDMPLSPKVMVFFKNPWYT